MIEFSLPSHFHYGHINEYEGASYPLFISQRQFFLLDNGLGLVESALSGFLYVLFVSSIYNFENHLYFLLTGYAHYAGRIFPNELETK